MIDFFHNAFDKVTDFFRHILDFFIRVIKKIVTFMKREANGMTIGQRAVFYALMAFSALATWFCMISQRTTWLAFEFGLALLFVYLVYARVERYNRRVAMHNATPGAVSMGNCSIWGAVTYTLGAHFYWLGPVVALCFYIR